MPRATALTTLCLLCLLAGAAPAAEVPHVANGATPAHGVTDVRLQEVWRVGGEDDDANLFGVVAQVIADEKGNLYVLDGQLSEVAVFAPDGRRTGTLGREGEGPGEFRRPADAFFLPDGKLAVVQVFPGKIVQLDRAGNPAGTFPFQAGDPAAGGFAVLVGGNSRGGTTALCGIRQTFAAGKLNQTYFLDGVRADGSTLGTIATKTAVQDFGNMVLDELAVDFVWSRWGVAPNGEVYAAPHRDRYLVERHAADGKLLGTFERPYESLARDRADHDRAESLLKAQARNYPVPPPVKVADREPDIQSLTVLADGTVWILSGRGQRGQPDGVMLTYDVFDAKGAFDRQVRVHADADGLEDQLFLISPDRAVLVLNFWDAFLAGMGAGDETAAAADVAPMEIISCRIVQ